MFPQILRQRFSSGLIILILLFLQTLYGKEIDHCDPSACGNLQNISYPFRLRDDPPYCGDPKYELVCENNTAFSYRNSHDKYRVETINYQNYTIRFSDPSIITNDTCSFSQYSWNDFESGNLLIDPWSFHYPYALSPFARVPQPVNFLSCPHPVNQSTYVNADLCAEKDSIGRHKYVKLGHMNVSEVEEMCTIGHTAMTSMPFQEGYNNFSLLDIHSSLLYGFELSWYEGRCGGQCKRKYQHCQQDGYRPILCRSFIHDIGIKQLLTYGMEAIGEVIVLIIGFGIAVKIIIGWPIFLGLLIYILRRRHLSTFDVIESFLQNHNNLSPIRYSYSNIKKMTVGFRQKLGQGGFGTVYKGKLRSGHHVAVKVLCTRSKSDGQDFVNEVSTIGRIHHVNIVKLVGYCAEGSKRALIYDFMPNGSLDKYLIGQETTKMLNWEKRFDIAVGVARGIEYLHRGCDIQILHFDIKPHNILLDENFTPKISDFGLARFYPTESKTVILTAARGTIGYVAPELINRSVGNVSCKADVYSFGMLLMEMVGLKRDLVTNCDESSQYFPYWIYNHLENKDVEAGIDDLDEQVTRKMAIVGLWCIQMSPGDRPSMGKVVEMLEGEVAALQIPPQPAYSEPQVVAQTWETDTTGSVALLSEDVSKNQILRSL